MNRRYLGLAIAWLLSGIVSCASVPVHYHTLSRPPDKSTPVSETIPVIVVRVIHAPPQLNRAELTVRSGPTEVMLLENERWASPLNDEIKEALRLELQRRLARATALRASFAALTIDLDVRRLEAEPGRYALLEASWSAASSGTGRESKGGPARMCTFKADESIHAGYPEIVEGYQRAIAALADAIVGVLTSPASGLDVPCQKSIEDSAGGSSPKSQ
jgi:uncharacterized protein